MIFSRMAIYSCLLLFASQDSSQTVSASDPQSVVSALQSLGYRAVLGRDSVGDPKITSSSNGVEYDIFFYGCAENKDCKDLQFSSAFNTTRVWTAEEMNEWNFTKLTGKVSVDEDGDPRIRLLVPGVLGVPYEAFERVVVRWDNAFGDFLVLIDW